LDVGVNTVGGLNVELVNCNTDEKTELTLDTKPVQAASNSSPPSAKANDGDEVENELIENIALSIPEL
jgi:hypothetical protein